MRYGAWRGLSYVDERTHRVIAKTTKRCSRTFVGILRKQDVMKSLVLIFNVVIFMCDRGRFRNHFTLNSSSAISLPASPGLCPPRFLYTTHSPLHFLSKQFTGRFYTLGIHYQKKTNYRASH